MLHDSALLPLLTALVAGALAARMAGSAVRGFAPQKPLWALGLLLFAAASGAAAYGTADGWGEASFTVYYLAGACLCVALLGAGSAFLALPRPIAHIVLGATATACVAAAVTVIIAPVDQAILDQATGLGAPSNDALGGSGYLWAIAMNTVGTALLVAGAVVSIARRRRPGPNAAILAGVLVIALAGTLTRLGGEELLYEGQLAGLLLLGAGLEWANRAAAAVTRPIAA
ncbi:MAG: hypothetical protein ACO3KD_02945 [Gaiellales bacterium]